MPLVLLGSSHRLTLGSKSSIAVKMNYILIKISFVEL